MSNEIILPVNQLNNKKHVHLQAHNRPSALFMSSKPKKMEILQTGIIAYVCMLIQEVHACA